MSPTPRIPTLEEMTRRTVTAATPPPPAADGSVPGKEAPFTQGAPVAPGGGAYPPATPTPLLPTPTRVDQPVDPRIAKGRADLEERHEDLTSRQGSYDKAIKKFSETERPEPTTWQRVADAMEAGFSPQTLQKRKEMEELKYQGVMRQLQHSVSMAEMALRSAAGMPLTPEAEQVQATDRFRADEERKAESRGFLSTNEMYEADREAFALDMEIKRMEREAALEKLKAANDPNALMFEQLSGRQEALVTQIKELDKVLSDDTMNLDEATRASKTARRDRLLKLYEQNEKLLDRLQGIERPTEPAEPIPDPVVDPGDDDGGGYGKVGGAVVSLLEFLGGYKTPNEGTGTPIVFNKKQKTPWGEATYRMMKEDVDDSGTQLYRVEQPDGTVFAIDEAQLRGAVAFDDIPTKPRIMELKAIVDGNQSPLVGPVRTANLISGSGWTPEMVEFLRKYAAKNGYSNGKATQGWRERNWHDLDRAFRKWRKFHSPEPLVGFERQAPMGTQERVTADAEKSEFGRETKSLVDKVNAWAAAHKGEEITQEVINRLAAED